MWIDPVFVFHLMNTGLLATKQEINRRLKRYHCEKTGILRLGGKPCKAVFESFPELENDRYAESCMALAKKLANKPLVEIDPFVARFFILENQHVEDCDSDLLPALVAFHELCGAKAFFLRKEGLEDYLMSEEVSLWDRYDQSIQETWAGLDSPTGDEWRDYEFANGLDFWAFPKFPEFFFVLEEGDGHGRLRCYSYRKGQVLAGDMPPNNHGAFLIQTLADAYLTGISSAPVDPIRKALLWEQKGVIERTTLSIG
jgi:hypothetical protein